MSKIALDTNILIYLHESGETSGKREIANKLVAAGPVIFPQVISEYLNVCNKRLKMTKQDCLAALMDWLPYCELASSEISVFVKALGLVTRYQFQLFDAIIVSSALLSDCSILYSEDMQHELIVDGKLKIVNPFKLA